MLFSKFLFASFFLTTLLVPTHSVFAQESTPNETASPVGEYVLVSANSQELPAVVSESGISRQEVVGGSVLLEADGTHMWRTNYRYTEGGSVPERSESSGRGSYSQQGKSIIFLFEAGDGQLEGTLDGNTLTIQADVPMVYRKVFGQGPTRALPSLSEGSRTPPPPAPPPNHITFTLSLDPGSKPTSLQELCESSTQIVEARVQSILPPRQNVRYPLGAQLLQKRTFPIFRYLETDVILTVSQVLKGTTSIRQVVISQKGGVLGQYKELPTQYSLMQPGEHYIVFLADEKQPDLPEVTGIPRYALNGSWTGVFRIDESGVHVSPDAGDVIRERFDGKSSQVVITEIQRSCHL